MTESEQLARVQRFSWQIPAFGGADYFIRSAIALSKHFSNAVHSNDLCFPNKEQDRWIGINWSRIRKTNTTGREERRQEEEEAKLLWV